MLRSVEDTHKESVEDTHITGNIMDTEIKGTEFMGVLNISLDTHVLIWWVNGDPQLSGPASARIDQELGTHSGLLVSAISAWEVAMLINKGRLALAMDIQSWLAEIASIPAVKFVPIDPTLAVKSTSLPGTFHSDPADRMIVALAREQSVPLISADKKIQAYDHVRTLW